MKRRSETLFRDTENHGYKRILLKGGVIVTQKFIIDGRLPSLNDYCKAERTGYHIANKMKHSYQTLIIVFIRRARLKPIKRPVKIVYRFYEANKRRDKDNVSGLTHKFVQDALVESGILKDDGWEFVSSFSDEFYIDKKNPRIEVTLIEECETNNIEKPRPIEKAFTQ